MSDLFPYDEQQRDVVRDDYAQYSHKKKLLDVTILVFDKDDNCIREHKKNFKDKDHRRWLNTMLYWAISNGYSIEINS